MCAVVCCVVFFAVCCLLVCVVSVCCLLRAVGCDVFAVVGSVLFVVCCL